MAECAPCSAMDSLSRSLDVAIPRLVHPFEWLQVTSTHPLEPPLSAPLTSASCLSTPPPNWLRSRLPDGSPAPPEMLLGKFPPPTLKHPTSPYRHKSIDSRSLHTFTSSEGSWFLPRGIVDADEDKMMLSAVGADSSANGLDIISSAENMRDILMAPIVRDAPLNMTITNVDGTLFVEAASDALPRDIPVTAQPAYRVDPKERELRSKFLYRSLDVDNSIKHLTLEAVPLVSALPAADDALLSSKNAEQAAHFPANAATLQPPSEPVSHVSTPPLVAASGPASQSDCFVLEPYRKISPTAATSDDITAIQSISSATSVSSSVASTGTNNIQRHMSIVQLKKMKLLLGSDKLSVKLLTPAAFDTHKWVTRHVTMHLHNIKKRITPLQALELFLDSKLAGVPDIAVCFHDEEKVAGYGLIKPHEVLQLSSPPVKEHEVEQSAAALLNFIAANCCVDGASYWLYKSRDDAIIRIFDVTGVDTEASDSNHSSHNSNSNSNCAGGGVYVPACDHVEQLRSNPFHPCCKHHLIRLCMHYSDQLADKEASLRNLATTATTSEAVHHQDVLIAHVSALRRKMLLRAANLSKAIIDEYAAHMLPCLPIVETLAIRVRAVSQLAQCYWQLANKIRVENPQVKKPKEPITNAAPPRSKHAKRGAKHQHHQQHVDVDGKHSHDEESALLYCLNASAKFLLELISLQPAVLEYELHACHDVLTAQAAVQLLVRVAFAVSTQISSRSDAAQVLLDCLGAAASSGNNGKHEGLDRHSKRKDEEDDDDDRFSALPLELDAVIAVNGMYAIFSAVGDIIAMEHFEQQTTGKHAAGTSSVMKRVSPVLLARLKEALVRSCHRNVRDVMAVIHRMDDCNDTSPLQAAIIMYELALLHVDASASGSNSSGSGGGGVATVWKNAENFCEWNECIPTADSLFRKLGDLLNRLGQTSMTPPTASTQTASTPPASIAAAASSKSGSAVNNHGHNFPAAIACFSRAVDAFAACNDHVNGAFAKCNVACALRNLSVLLLLRPINTATTAPSTASSTDAIDDGRASASALSITVDDLRAAVRWIIARVGGFSETEEEMPRLIFNSNSNITNGTSTSKNNASAEALAAKSVTVAFSACYTAAQAGLLSLSVSSNSRVACLESLATSLMCWAAAAGEGSDAASFAYTAALWCHRVIENAAGVEKAMNKILLQPEKPFKQQLEYIRDTSFVWNAMCDDASAMLRVCLHTISRICMNDVCLMDVGNEFHESLACIKECLQRKPDVLTSLQAAFVAQLKCIVVEAVKAKHAQCDALKVIYANALRTPPSADWTHFTAFLHTITRLDGS